MKCPVCRETRLVMSDRKGVEIDYCPDCRGVWLDRGELDKIIERSAEYDTQTTAAAPQSGHRPESVRSEHPVGNDHCDSRSSSKYDKKGRKKNRMGDLLGDIFDF